MAGATEVHAIIPHFSYARSDKKDAPRICITAGLVAILLEASGATHVMTMALHSPQVHGFFRIPADPLTSRPVLSQRFRERDLSSTIVVAPDMGHANTAARFARGLGLPVAAGHKERISDTRVRISGIVGQQVRDCRRALIYDDEIVTGGSVLELSRLLIEHGIEEIWVACTHGAFVEGALERIAAVPEITEIVTTDTVRIPSEKRHPKLHVLPAGPVFGEAIRRNYLRQSIGNLAMSTEEEEMNGGE
jgi:ribose-phosphate pyrophosphokinase